MTLKRVYEICDQYTEFSAVSVFIEFSKVFDSVGRVNMMLALNDYGIPPYLIRH